MMQSTLKASTLHRQLYRELLRSTRRLAKAAAASPAHGRPAWSLVSSQAHWEARGLEALTHAGRLQYLQAKATFEQPASLEELVRLSPLLCSPCTPGTSPRGSSPTVAPSAGARVLPLSDVC